MSRALWKTVSYRLVSMAVTMLVVAGLTGSWAVGASLGVAEILGKGALYYLHERAWSRFWPK